MAGPAEQPRDVLSFGPFRLAVSERLLTKDGAPVELGARWRDGWRRRVTDLDLAPLRQHAYPLGAHHKRDEGNPDRRPLAQDLDLPGICGERFRFYAARPSN